MSHLPNLIHDLALILAAAGIVSIICKRLKQPVVLGYILAGFLVGPHFHVFPTITEIPSIQTWAEIGVIFLLFGLGLEFSFRKLAKVGPSASVTAIVEIVSMLGLGFICAQTLDWSKIDSLFLGGILSISSTTIILRTFEELGLKSKKFVNLVFGVLIVEDLVAILLLVLLSTMAVSQQFEGGELLFKGAKLGFFLVLWFIGGIFVLPTLLKKARRFLNDETMLIVSLGLCLGMVLLAHQAGFSPALGAFIMGSLLAETTEAERIEHITKPVKDFFAAVFFVSVGMLINPQTLVEQAEPVLWISLVTIVGKTLSTGFGALISGQSLRHSVQTGMSLAQIGEFSFIIASLGLTLKVTSDFLYPVAVAVSAITTLTTPYLIRAADPCAVWIENRLPAAWLERIRRYHSAAQRGSQNREWRRRFKIRFARLLVNSVLAFSVFWLSHSFCLPRLRILLGDGPNAVVIYAVLTLLFSAPFLWAIAFGGSRALSMRDALQEARNAGPLFLLEIFRVLVAGAFVTTFLSRLELFHVGIGVIAVGVAVFLLIFWLRLGLLYRWLEEKFISNLNEREIQQAEAALSPLAPWDAHIARFKVTPEHPQIGSSLSQLGIREKFGVTVALIQRGRKRIAAPGRDEKLFPHDEIGVIGTDEQLAKFKHFLAEGGADPSGPSSSEYVLRCFSLGPNSPFNGKVIRDSGLREKASGLVVGIERSGQRYLNPDSLMKLEEGDLVWIVGEDAKIAEL